MAASIGIRLIAAGSWGSIAREEMVSSPQCERNVRVSLNCVWRQRSPVQIRAERSVRSLHATTGASETATRFLGSRLMRGG
jgi:hypothetical protein